jgi:hypothetical protein
LKTKPTLGGCRGKEDVMQEEIIEVRMGKKMYTVKFETIEGNGKCKRCKRIKPDVQRIRIEWIVRQQSWRDGKDIDPESPLGKRIVKRVRADTIYEEWCQDCRDEESGIIPL